EKIVELYGDDISSEINAVINVGDIVTDGWNVGEYEEEYFKPIAALSGEIPYMVAIGNHEAEADYYYQYMKYDDCAGAESEKYWSMRIAGVLFIGLNSNTKGSTQLNWLASELNSAETDETIGMVFTFLHHPGRSEVWPDGNTSWVQDDVIPLLAQYSKAECLSYGHSHNYERGAWPEGNLQLLLAGGGGSDLDRWGMYSNQEDYPEIFRAHDHFGYTIFDVDLDAKSYSAESYTLGHTDLPLENILLDSFGRDSIAPPIETPTLVGPPGEVSLPVTLLASDQDNLCSSHFQLVTDGGDWQNPLLDSLRDYENVYGDSGSPDYTPIDLNGGINLTELALDNALLAEDQTYRWRVRYRDENLHWTSWSDEFQFTVVDPTGVDLPNKTGLLNCFPNPFNPSTTVQYTLLNAGQVNVSVYNLDGQHVTTLVDQLKEAGPHSALWDGTDSRGKQLTSGVYLLKMEASEIVEVQKVALVR
ncbi:MAG: T9SS type A sorting domain-containing protein, partial [Gammaproteobacteria bacterium]|nr:T9SS type A sorting domain-containing protein [Gammaproteobacteria bacterium]